MGFCLVGFCPVGFCPVGFCPLGFCPGFTHQKDGTNGSPEQSTRDPARRTTTEGKATKSLVR